MRLALAVCLLVGAQAPAGALVLLTANKQATFRDRPGANDDSAQLDFGRDRAFRNLEDPTCPAESTLQFASYPQATNLVEPGPVIHLPCENWRARRNGYQYQDPKGTAGGVRKIQYTKNRLLIRALGRGYTAIAGPAGYVEMWLTIGPTRYLARFHNFRRNDRGMMVTRRPSKAAAAGEAAFWDTLWGDADRQEDTLRNLEKAVARTPEDGRSHFLLGMMHLYRLGRDISDFGDPSAFALAEAEAAEASFGAAVPLLWDGDAGDSRVPGFAAAATYVNGIVHKDAALVQQGLDDLDATVALNPLFNSFDLIGVVPPVVPPSDPLYQTKVLPLLDDLLATSATCVQTQPELCGNAGMAPRNLEGATLLFGDIYAKGGRPADAGSGRPSDAEQARTWYNLSLAASEGWRFRALAEERVATLDQRVALYRDADRSNDPRIVGTGPEACAFCHNR
jgi:hypothetical protein